MRIRIEPCPKTGDGVNTWVNSHVLRMLRAGMTNRTIYMMLQEHAKGCGRDIKKDITHSIETGRTFLGIGKGFQIWFHDDIPTIEISSLKDLPPFDYKYQTEILEKHQAVTLPTVTGLKTDYDTLGILYHLFHKNRICIGYNQSHSVIVHLTDVNSVIRLSNHRIRLGLCQFIVPTPMVGEYAINKTGKRSVRCLDNTCERWFLVIEFDRLPSQDDQIRLHYELSKIRELRMLVFSGNKSIHGWYDVYRQSEKENKKLMKVATRLGADPMTWIRCQYVRFPGGVNDRTKQKQEILYYNYGK